ncbi:MAG TPA: isoprenyl transferase [Methylomirabilota bacterium]|nr:isoprenyl transferase [Methylomirabilota bacterium]
MSGSVEKERLPRHVAVIMDGNGRWAQRRGLSRVEGHKRGKAAVQAVVEASGELGLEYLTLYAFSTENWQRPVNEVRALMSLLRRYLRTELHKLMENNIRLRAVGDLSRLPAAVRQALEHAVLQTQDNTGLTVVLAISYGGREEIAHAARSVAAAVQAGRIALQDVTEETFAQHLWTSGIPDPDLLIRTSGEFRLSNFLLWQLAYTEIYVTDTLWPDFGREEFLRALADYQSRERRFGRTAEQPPAAEFRRVAR